jgi:hypothetical protein
MNLDFKKVSYEGDLSDFSEDELTQLISEFEAAQDSNVAEFEKAAEAATDIDESTIAEFEDAREDLIGDIVEAEEFDSIPLTEEKLGEEDFAELQEWKEFVAEQGSDSEVEPDADADGGSDFDDMGKESPTSGGDETEDFADEALEDVQGLNI